MCPPAPDPIELVINESWTGEKLVRFLVESKGGDPLPQNVLTDVDLFSFEPCHFPENIWYLCNSDDQQFPNRLNEENGIREAQNGYWKSIDATSIATSTSVIGRKTTLVFFEGRVPLGIRSRWVMHEYCAERNEEVINRSQEYSSLCTVFLQEDQRPNDELQQISGDVDVDSAQIESYLLHLLEVEEQNAAIEKSQLVAGSEQRVTSSSKGADEQKNRNQADDISAPHTFSSEDYLELNDLLSSESASSSSGNSSKRSINSDEYFDPDALLEEIAKDCSSTGGEHNLDCKFSISAPARSDQVVISLSEPDLIQSQANSVIVARSRPEDPVLSDGTNSDPALPCSTAELRHDEDSSGFACHSVSQVKRSRSDGSKGSSKSPQRQSSISKIAKIGKKYCCIVPF